MSKPTIKIITLSILLFLILLLAYANHFNNGFHFDDSHTIVDNIHIRSLHNIPAFFRDPRMFSADPGHWGLRPLVTTTLAIDYWLGAGLHPFYFQLSTFIWFLVLGAMLFFVYKKLLIKSGNALFAGYLALAGTAWYLLNTANAETINYIISRSDVLSTCCIVASFLIYIALPAKRNLGLYILPALLGVFAKETLLVLIILLFFYKLLFEENLSIEDLFKKENLKKIGKIILQLLPLTVVILMAQLYTLSKAGTISGISNPFFPYLLTQTWVWLHYAVSFLLPVNLSADTDWTVIPNLLDERILVGVIFVVLLIITIFRSSAKNETRPIAFGLIWFAAALLPTSLAPFAEVTNDHRMFFPFIGLAISAVTYIGLWLVKVDNNISRNKYYQPAIAAGIAVILLLNVWGIYQRNKIWKTEESLWLDVTQKSPLNGRGQMNYGLTQMSKGNYADANQYFQKACLTLPYYNTLFINMGILDGATGKPLEADANFKKAISLSPNTDDGYAFYARYLQHEGRNSESLIMAAKALTINHYSVIALMAQLAAYNGLQQWDDLETASKKALAVVPGDILSASYLKASMQRKNIIAGSQNNYQPTAENLLDKSLAYYNDHNYKKCIEACKAAIHIKFNYADAYSNMGASYNQLSQFDSAIIACQMALKINPAHKLAKGNLDWATKGLVKK